MEEQDEYKRFRSSGAAAPEEKSHQPYEDGNHCDDYGMDACLTVGNYPSDGVLCGIIEISKGNRKSHISKRNRIKIFEYRDLIIQLNVTIVT